jgi:hypothetical protein
MHPNVGATEPLEGIVDKFAACQWRPTICLQKNRIGSEGRNLVSRFLRRSVILGEVDTEPFGPGGGESEGDLPPDSARRSGYNSRQIG